MPRYLVNVDGQDYDVELEYRAGGYKARIDGTPVNLTSHPLSETRSVLLVDDRSFEVDIHSDGFDDARTVFMLGVEIPVRVEGYHLARLRRTAGMTTDHSIQKSLPAPMPGLILEVKVSDGDKVAKGDPLVIIEAMKMENVIKAPADGVVKTVNVAQGDSVEKGDQMLEFE